MITLLLALALAGPIKQNIDVPLTRSPDPVILSEEEDGLGYVYRATIELPAKRTYFLDFDCGDSFGPAKIMARGDGTVTITFRASGNTKVMHCYLRSWITDRPGTNKVKPKKQ
jgi:hypothetical protein